MEIKCLMVEPYEGKAIKRRNGKQGLLCAVMTVINENGKYIWYYNEDIDFCTSKWKNRVDIKIYTPTSDEKLIRIGNKVIQEANLEVLPVLVRKRFRDTYRFNKKEYLGALSRINYGHREIADLPSS